MGTVQQNMPKPYVVILCLSFYITDIYFLKVLTLWYVKKVVMITQPRPIWENTLNTLDADPLANKIASW